MTTTTALAFVLACLPAQEGRDAPARTRGLSMADAAIDDAFVAGREPFGYLLNPVEVLGVPEGVDAFQVTPDGAFYSGSAELFFVAGEELVPLHCRVRTWEGGRPPVLTWSVRRDGAQFEGRAFAAVPDLDPTRPPVLCAELTVTPGKETDEVTFGVAVRFRGAEKRCARMAKARFAPGAKYRFAGGLAVRDDHVLYVVDDEPHARHEVLGDGPVLQDTTVLVSEFRVRGGKKTITVKFPLTPAALADADTVKALRAATFASLLAPLRATFAAVYDQAVVRFLVPERKLRELLDASLYHTLVAIDRDARGRPVQKVNDLHYDDFYLRDGSYMVVAHDFLGQHALAERSLEIFLEHQREDGNFLSQGGQLDGFGQALWALGRHWRLTGDRSFARRVLPAVVRATGWFAKTTKADALGLLPPTNAHDNEGIDGRYTGHNFLAHGGLLEAEGLAIGAGEPETAAKIARLREEFARSLQSRLATLTAKTGGYLPPGLDVEGGMDWGNLEVVYPGRFLSPLDPWVTATLAKVRRERFAEGLICYTHQGPPTLHHYLTSMLTETHIARGDVSEALADIYAMAAHTTAAHAGFEYQVPAWATRDYGENYPPHGWFAAKFISCMRNALVREDGEDLHLASVISPAWREGEGVEVRNAPTDFGRVSYRLRFAGDRVKLSWSLRRGGSASPKRILFHVPFAGRRTVVLRGDEGELEEAIEPIGGGAEKPGTAGEPRSYDTAVRRYVEEYRARFADHVEHGGKVLSPVTVERRSKAERAELFARRFAPGAIGIAVGKPVRSSGGTEGRMLPELAFDGDAEDRRGAWMAGPSDPPAEGRWIEVDLQEQHVISRLHAFPYWDGSRSYRYRILLSEDGERFTTVVDRTRGDEAPETAEGKSFAIPPTAARFVRMHFFANTANPSFHLVELRVFGEPAKGR